MNTQISTPNYISFAANTYLARFRNGWSGKAVVIRQVNYNLVQIVHICLPMSGQFQPTSTCGHLEQESPILKGKYGIYSYLGRT